MFNFKYEEERWMIMTKKGSTILVLLACIFLFCVAPVTAAINTISQGNAVFIGEEGLDISAAMGPDTKDWMVGFGCGYHYHFPDKYD